MLEDYEKLLIADFISEHWEEFIQHAEEFGYSADDAEKIAEALEDKTQEE